ncbi:MAG: NAD(P)/FAD-dependent oxidoreductase [Acidimicrobiales bacterium]
MAGGNGAEIVVAGGGMAGLSAGLFGARTGRRTTVLVGEQMGGHLVTIGTIEDYPGFPEGVPGYDLCPMLQEQAENAGAELVGGTLESLARDDAGWVITSSEGELHAPVVIVATGSALRALEVPGEERLFGKGVSDCATCDGPFHRGKTVAVAGSGDSALLEALELTNHVDKVLLFARGDHLEGQKTYAQRVSEHAAIDVRFDTSIQEIVGDDVVQAVRVRRGGAGETEEVAVSGVFVYVGIRPRTEFLGDLLKLDAEGRVPTDGQLHTELEGLFVAGDIRSDSSNQAVAAAGDGATAAIAADAYLSGEAWPRR